MGVLLSDSTGVESREGLSQEGKGPWGFGTWEKK